jgi:hypothetical protein
MTFKPKLWYPIALVLSALNLVGVGVAAGEAQAWHAGVHATLALLFGLWAQRLRGRRPGGAELDEDRLEALDALETEVGRLSQDMSEMQERLDFTERVLAQRAENRQLGPER